MTTILKQTFDKLTATKIPFDVLFVAGTWLVLATVVGGVSYGIYSLHNGAPYIPALNDGVLRRF